MPQNDTILPQIEANRNNIARVKRPATGRPFVKGDPRCWRKGRPRSFDQVRAIAQQLSHEPRNGQLAIIDLLREWRDSKEPALQMKFIEYAFGKVPDKLETTGLENKTNLVLYFNHERGLTIDEDNSRSPSEISSGTD